ncbi:hypothetical protein G9A89_014594 [Geosiphon pyriformis]|nr:hypothetical protein G9A89_014594 [Geosiphon pyriformis]
MLSEEYNWIDIAIRRGVCNQTCQYALSILEKVKRGIPFNATYNSAFNKLYHYSYDAEIIFDLAMALINEATQKDVYQMKEAEYIEYTMELAEFNYKNKRTSTINNHPKVAELEIIETNHLGFAKFLFQHRISYKITDCLEETVNIESARENFYTKLFQHTSLPRNYSFAPIIREINQAIKRYTQQQFPITYVDKGKGRLQTPVVTPKQIQLPNWKKTQVELSTNLSYHYMPRSAINISSTDMSTSIFGCFSFQSKQQKTELLRSYDVTKTETDNKGKQKVKQHSKTTPNTPILPKTTAKHLQTPEQKTSVKLLLSITPFPISLAQPQTPNSPSNHFSRPEDFQSPRNPTQQQESISTSTNIIEYLQKNESDHSENLKSEETELEQREATENKEEMTTAYIAKIPEFTDEDNDTSPQE